MGNKNKKQQMRTNQAASDAAGAQYTDAYNQIRNPMSAGDVMKQSDFIGNAAMTANRQRQRELRVNLQPSGAMALGMAAANPQALAQQKLMLEDAWSRDAAAQAESDVQNYQNNQRNLNFALLNSANSRQQAFSGMATQIAGQLQSPIPGLIGAGIGAAGSIIGAGIKPGSI